MKRHLLILVGLGAVAFSVQGQTENKTIRTANKLYKEGKYDKALPEYEKAVAQNPNNPVTHYNLGNAQFRKEDFPGSAKNFEDAASTATTNEFKQRSLYNKGVSLSKQKKLQESIDAYKRSLRLNPQDEDNRYNLEKALAEQKKQNESKDKKDQEQKDKKDQKKQQKQQPKPQPKQNLDKKKIEQFLKSLEQKEQEVQRKMQQNKTRAASQQEKDW